MQITNIWDRLLSFAKGIKLDSISIGQAQFKFSSSEEHTSAFTQIRERVHSPKDKTYDVFVLSAHNVDEVTVVDRIEADHECEALENTLRVSGGSGANTAYVLTTLSAHVGISGILGEDSDGLKLRGEFADIGVDTRMILTSRELPTGRTTTLVERSGNRLIVVFPGINNRFAGLVNEDILFEKAHSSRIVHLSSFVGLQERLLQQRLVGRIGLKSVVSLTPGAIYARQGLDRLETLLRHVDLMFVYREQLAQLVENSSASTLLHGNRTVNLLESFFAWRKRKNINTPVVVVVKDPEERRSGTVNERYLSVGVGGPTLEHYIAPQQLPQDVRLQVVDTTGAGDAVAAGFLYGLLNAASLEACIDFAFLMAAFASTELGPRTAFKSSKDIALLSDVQQKLIAPVSSISNDSNP